VPRGYIDGLILSNGSDATNDIDIAAGEATDTTQAAVMTLAGITKQLDSAWAVGTAQGGRDTGSIADGWWHLFLIQRSDTSVVDALFSTSATAPTMPANYDRKRRIGAVLRTAGALVAFAQVRDVFLWTTPILDVDANNPGTSAVLNVMSVPTGIRAIANGNAVLISTGTDSLCRLSSPLQTDVAASETASPLAELRADASSDTEDMQQWEMPADTSGRIRYRLTFSDANTTLRMTTEGWTDSRGKDA
jgi:hypothetical protein